MILLLGFFFGFVLFGTHSISVFDRFDSFKIFCSFCFSLSARTYSGIYWIQVFISVRKKKVKIQYEFSTGIISKKLTRNGVAEEGRPTLM